MALYIITSFTLNLKVGVTQPDWYSPEIQKNYQEMAEHYDTVIMPARIRKPRDYLQNRIIFKNGGVASSAINEGV
jgi:hypothetical protein